MPNGVLSKGNHNKILPWIPPHPSARLCEKCGHIGQLWQWWKIAFCRACLCFSIRTSNVTP